MKSYLALLYAAMALASPAELSRRETSYDWCGYVQKVKNVQTVEASWIVPTGTAPPGTKSSQEIAGYQWVGIDGDCAALIQGGTSVQIKGGVTSYEFWYEFLPGKYTKSSLKVSPGNSVYAKVTATSTTGGTVYLKNLTTGKSITHTPVSPGKKLCLASAEWIEEYPPHADGFAIFGDFSFTKISATDSGGNKYNLKGAVTQTLTRRGGSTLCKPSHSDDDSFEVSYTGSK